MKTFALALSALVLGASLGTASAEPANPAAALVPVGAAQAVQPVVEGRQATAVTASASLSGAERLVIERNVSSNR